MKIGFIGAGNIAGALINGILKSSPSQFICVSDKNSEKLASLSRACCVDNMTGNHNENSINILNTNTEVVENSDVIILAVKPNVYSVVLEEAARLPEHLLCSKIFVTVAPGISIDFVKKFFSGSVKIVRSMPNIPVKVGCGMTVICAEHSENLPEEIAIVQRIFNCVGNTCLLPERHMDAAVAVCGSSPAYVYMLLEAMASTAVKYGLDYDTAYAMAAQSIMGAAKMVIDTGTHPAKLRESVCSPGGTTIEAVLELENLGFKSSINSAMIKCTERAVQLAR